MNLLRLIPLLTICACSSTVPRTKSSDKSMRIMVDPASVDVPNHVRLQNALVNSGKWIVVDRRAGLNAIKKEQEELHRNASERYEDKAKYAQWGKLYGIGSVAVGHSQCRNLDGLWGVYHRCKQTLELVDSNTGEVIVSVSGEEDAKYGESPEWTKTVDKLDGAYPKAFETFTKHQKLELYEQESEEAAVREKEKSK